MSTIALRELLDELTDKWDIKALRRQAVNVPAHSILIEKSDLIEQFADSLKTQYRLNPEETQEVRDIVAKEWGGIILRAHIHLKKPRKNIVPIIESTRIIAIYYGVRKNYYAITDDFFKPKGAYYPIFAGVLKKLKEYIIQSDRKIRNRIIDKGENKGQSVEAFGISDIFDQGHYLGSNVHYAIASKFLPNINNPDVMKVLATAPVEGNPFNTEENILVAVSSKFSSDRPENDDFKKTITVRLESKRSNTEGSQVEKQIRPAVIQHVRQVLSGITPIEWVNKESSDSVMTTIEKSLINTAIKAGAKGTRRGYNTKPNKVEEVKKFKTKIPTSKARVRLVGPKLSAASQVQPSWLSLIAIINAQLPPQVRANMGSPRLNNVTGRLSESAKVTNIVATPTGFPSIEYTYQRSPYDVFDRTLGKSPWNTPDRDPSELVGMSVRQIAQELGFRRFYTRRAR